MTLIQYILHCLKKNGCHHIVGVPGTSCAAVYFAVDKDPEMSCIVTVNELEAGYIADGYGRFAGMGAVAVSYGVGSLSMINAIASAYTEKVPMIILNGGPTAGEQSDQDQYGILFSHSTGQRHSDLEAFKNVTVAAAIIDDMSQAQRVIADLFRQAKLAPGPVYLEVANNRWNTEIDIDEEEEIAQEATIPAELVVAFHKKISAASNPVLVLGSELSRRRLEGLAEEFVDRFKIPFVTTLLSKSLLDERHPLFIGTYDSDLVNKPPRRYAESSDCLIALGCIFGIDHGTLVKSQYDNMIDVSYGKARIGTTKYREDVSLERFLQAVLSIPRAAKLRSEQEASLLKDKLQREKSERPSHDTVFKTINKFISDKGDKLVMVADTCLSSYPAADLDMSSTRMFLANPVWLSIGQGTPASIGAYLATGKRPIIVTGDGGFQMIAQTFSTMVKYRIPAIIAVIDNGIYGIEQFLLDKTFYTEHGKPPIDFNLLNRWKYENFPDVFGGGKGFRMNDTRKVYEVLEESFKYTDGPVIIAVEVDIRDIPTEYVKYIEEDKSGDHYDILQQER